MKKIIFMTLLLSLNAFAQQVFEVKNASEKFDVKIEAEKCDESSCEGKTTYTLFNKGTKTVFQKFTMETSSIWLSDDKQPTVNKTLLYDEQSAFSFEDYNFDGIKDLSINDGNNGGYGMPSYQIYLFSKTKNKFVNNTSFTNLAQGYLGMFEVDANKKMLYTYSKSGCCWHRTEGFSVIKNRPIKIYEMTEDATDPQGEYVVITTKTLVKGKWQTKVRKEKMEDDR